MIFRNDQPDLNIPDCSYPEFALSLAGAFGDRPAFVDGPSGRSISYRELADRSRRIAAALSARGMKKGDVFGIWLPNLPEYPPAFYGVIAAGGVVTTVSPLYTPAELVRQLKETGARYLLTLPQLLEGARAVLPEAGLREVFALGEAEGATPYAELSAIDAAPPRVEIDPKNDPAVLPCSSGTTGMPKAVMLTHRNLMANALQVAAAPVGWAEHEVVVGVPPMFHAYGICAYFGTGMYLGHTVVTMPRFDLEQFLQIVQRHRATVLHTVPPIALALAHHPLVDKYDLSSVRKVFSGAAPLAEAVANAVERRLGAALFEGYGMTELACVSHMQSVGTPKRSVGRALPGIEWKVVDTVTGDDLKQCERGEIWVRGPNVMKGYLNRPEDTAAVLQDGGWMRTGDIGFADEGENCVIVDRLKELIKYKGYQVAPAELEGILLQHPNVADACVIPLADAEAGEVPKAFVVTKGEVGAETLLEFVAGKVAPYKRVRALEFVDALPRSLAGKLLRRVLVERERSRPRAAA